MNDDLEEEYDIFMRESHETAGKRATLAFTKGQIRRAKAALIEKLTSRDCANYLWVEIAPTKISHNEIDDLLQVAKQFLESNASESSKPEKPLPEAPIELGYCKKCIQMTNHRSGALVAECMKCKTLREPLDKSEKPWCDACSLKCMATGCECTCHDKPENIKTFMNEGIPLSSNPEKPHRHRWGCAELGSERCLECTVGRRIPIKQWNKKYPHCKNCGHKLSKDGNHFRRNIGLTRMCMVRDKDGKPCLCNDPKVKR